MSYKIIATRGLYDIVQVNINSGQLMWKIFVKEFVKGLITLGRKLNRTMGVNLDHG